MKVLSKRIKEEYSNRELILLGNVLFLSGLVLGLLLMPAKNVTIGSYNGNGNGVSK